MQGGEAEAVSVIWRWVAMVLSGAVVSMVGFWLSQARHYVTRDEVVELVKQVMGKEEILSSLRRIEDTSGDNQRRLRTLEASISKLEGRFEDG